MLRYELLILASPEITRDEESNLEKQIDLLANKAKGSVLAFDRWGKYRLAYPVKGNDYGVYFLVRFDVEDEKIFEELRRMFYVKFGDIVMRHLISKLDINASLEYKRPPSLEDSPKRHIGFLEETELKHSSTSLKSKKPEVVEEKEVVEEVVEEEEPESVTMEMSPQGQPSEIPNSGQKKKEEKNTQGNPSKQEV
jgi:ribosomal protein S6